MRRVRYVVAMSLDGYIAGPNGEAHSESRPLNKSELSDAMGGVLEIRPLMGP